MLNTTISRASSVPSVTWRWAFYINLVIGAALAPISLFILPSLHPFRDVSFHTRLATLGFVGFVLGACLWVKFALAFAMADGQWA